MKVEVEHRLKGDFAVTEQDVDSLAAHAGASQGSRHSVTDRPNVGAGGAIEVFEPHRNYQIEDAGTHADGTPLLAIYVSDPVPDASAAPPNNSAAQQTEQRKES